MASSALEILVHCAQAIEDGDLKLADSFLERIWNLASDESDIRQRNLVKYFAEALARRAYGLHPAGNYFTLELTTPFYHNWQLKFDYRVKNAINNAVMGKKRLHLIDFYIPHVHGSGYLFDGLCSLYDDFVSVRVSVIIPSFLEKKLNIRKEEEYIREQAKRFNVKLEENLKVIYANSLGGVDASLLDFRKTEDEGLIVYYLFKLHKLLAEEGAMERELLKLRHINPEIVIIEEHDANHNDSNFIARLKDSFQYYSFAFSFNYEYYSSTENYYRQQIRNIVGCEGRDRIVRQQTLAQWRSCLLTGGFFPISFESTEDDEIYNESLVRTKQNRPMYFISAWKLKDGEEHFNPTSKNLECQGFNPSLLLEDRVRTLPIFPEGPSLNHLAAVSEIYEMLEEVCIAYDLPLALTWACGVNVNELLYKKCTLSIQSTFCYAKSWNCAILNGDYGEHRLQEGHAIARKALQSIEQFHFEPSISKLKKADHPLAPNWSPDHAVMAICLQNYYNIDDVYVVELFFLGSKSLALRIFNDLKNMKKKFVTVRVVLQGLNEQGGVIPNFHPPLPTHSSSLPGPHKQGSGKQTPFEPLEINENEMVKGDLNNLPISSAKRRKSDVWEEFEKQDVGGKKCARCKHCEREFDGSSKKGTTHLRNHLKICKIKAEKVRDQQLIFPVGRGDSKNGSASEGIYSFDQDRSSMDVARMIIKHQYPLNMVEHEFFKILLKNLQPMFKLQSEEALLSNIFCVYEKEKHKFRGYFDKLSCRFNLTISLWAHDVEKVMCCYGVQFIDDDWELKKKILALKSSGNQFDKKKFFENFKDLCVDWNFDKKVCSVTIYNSSSCSEIAEEIRKSWHSFEASHPLSTFYLSSDECIRGLFGKNNSGENVGKSIHSVIRTSSSCLLRIHDIYKKLNQQEGRGYPLMNVNSDNNWSTCSLVLAIAAILDPRFKFAFVEFSYNTIYSHDAAKIHLTMIRNAFTGIFNEYASNSSTLLNAEENTMESFHRWINSQRNVNNEASWKSELDKYVHQPIISFNPEFDILSWWCEQASSFPILGRMVRDILAIPMLSNISESTFNEKVVMDNPIFTGLDPQIIEAMICGRDWLESPKGISNVEPNKRSGNIDCPIVKLEDSPALAHHSDIERFSSESDNEASGNQVLGRGATTWTEKDVRAYLVSPFTVEELQHFCKWQNHAISGEFVGRDKIQGNALAPLLKIPPHDVDLEDTRNYYIEDTVVNQFFVLLKRRYERFPHKYPKHHSFDSSTAAFLINGSKAESEVLSWVKQEDLKGVSKLFLPICLHQHWLLFYVDIDDKKLLWLDSNEHSRMSNVLEMQVIHGWFLKFLLPSMEHDHKNWLFDVPKNIPLQKNSVDCALFVMKYADCLTHGNYFLFTQDDMPHFRYRTFLDLCLGTLCSGRREASEEGIDIGKMMENRRSPFFVDHSNFTPLASKRQKADLSISTKDRKEKLGERIVTLQQLVSPFGKVHLAINYLHWSGNTSYSASTGHQHLDFCRLFLVEIGLKVNSNIFNLLKLEL
ncbi:hypothetical protein CRYUN_Cryun40dG0083500 [Craigia yunnanensis]